MKLSGLGLLLWTSGLFAAEPPAEPPAYAPEAAVAGSLRCVGADTMHDLAENWARGFRAFHPQASVSVRRDGKLAADGLAALIDGKADCALFVREPFASERAAFRSRFGHAPTLVPVAGGSRATKSATHAIAIYVNTANPLTGVTMAQLERIFAQTPRDGATPITTWGQLGLAGDWVQRPIRTVGMLHRRDSGNPPGIVNYLQERMLAGGEFRADLLEQPGTAEEPALDAIVRVVASDPAAIGYSGFAYVRAGAKTLAIAAVSGGPFLAGQPLEVATRAYALSRDIYIAVNRAPGQDLPPLLREFLRYSLSREGQRAVAADRMQFIALDAAQASAAARTLQPASAPR